MAKIIDLSGRVPSDRPKPQRQAPLGRDEGCKVLLFSGVRYERLDGDVPGRRHGGPGIGGGQPRRRKLKSA
jgi:hypothetical protein